MCKIGDIIVVEKFKDENQNTVSKHSFIVIDDKSNSIHGLNYDLVANMMCSFHSFRHKNKKLKYIQNLLVKSGQAYGDNINGKEGYIKINKVYYFKKNKIKYYVLAHLDGEVLKELFHIISVLHNERKLEIITTNL